MQVLFPVMIPVHSVRYYNLTSIPLLCDFMLFLLFLLLLFLLLLLLLLLLLFLQSARTATRLSMIIKK